MTGNEDRYFIIFFLQETVCSLYYSYNFKSALQNRLLHLHMNQQWSQSLLQEDKIWETASKPKRGSNILSAFCQSTIVAHLCSVQVMSIKTMQKLDKKAFLFSWSAHSMRRKFSRKQHKLILRGISSSTQTSDKEHNRHAHKWTKSDLYFETSP